MCISSLIRGYKESYPTNVHEMMKAGITGHQQIGSPSTVQWVKDQLTSLIIQHHVCEGYTCLAIGADQLFAEILLAKDIPYIAIVPAVDYITTFGTTEDQNNYKRLLKKATHIHEMPSQKSTEQAFFDAGKQIVHSSDLLFAVWNGKPAKGLGGTADVVNYAVHLGKDVIHLNTSAQTCTTITGSCQTNP